MPTRVPRDGRRDGDTRPPRHERVQVRRELPSAALATATPGLRCLVSARAGWGHRAARVPRAEQTRGAAASPAGHGHAPVFPDVGSMSVSPGRSTPARSASSTMRRLMRSLTLPPALKNSHLATGSETGHERRAGASHTCRPPLPTRRRRDRPGLCPSMPAPTRRGPHGTSKGRGGMPQGAAHWPRARTPSVGQHSDLLAVQRAPVHPTRPACKAGPCPAAPARGLGVRIAALDWDPHALPIS